MVCYSKIILCDFYPFRSITSSSWSSFILELTVIFVSVEIALWWKCLLSCSFTAHIVLFFRDSMSYITAGILFYGSTEVKVVVNFFWSVYLSSRSRPFYLFMDWYQTSISNNSSVLLRSWILFFYTLLTVCFEKNIVYFLHLFYSTLILDKQLVID